MVDGKRQKGRNKHFFRIKIQPTKSTSNTVDIRIKINEREFTRDKIIKIVSADSKDGTITRLRRTVSVYCTEWQANMQNTRKISLGYRHQTSFTFSTIL